MAFVVLGVLLIVLKLLEIGSPATWSWLVVLAPFACAVAWWTWSDMTGRTRRLAMDKMDEKKVERRRKSLTALGIDPRAHDKEKQRVEKYKAERQRQIDKVEDKREAKRQSQHDSLVSSRFDSKMGALDGIAEPGARRPDKP